MSKRLVHALFSFLEFCFLHVFNSIFVSVLLQFFKINASDIFFKEYIKFGYRIVVLKERLTNRNANLL
jgi:hypothetical protein